MSIVIVVIMFFLAMVGKGRGVVNYKFTLEKIAFTLLFLPPLARIFKGHLTAFVPDMAAGIISGILSLIIVFLIVGFLLNRITKIPEYEDTGGDRSMGFIAGLIKGYAIVALLIIIYGLSFADRVAPEMITYQMKENFINSKIKNSIEYYRSSIYKIYSSAKSSDVGNLSGGQQYADTSVISYFPWTGNAPVEEVSKDIKEEKKKEEKKKK